MIPSSDNNALRADAKRTSAADKSQVTATQAQGSISEGSALCRPDLPDLLKAVQIDSIEDIHDAAVALQAIGQEYGLKMAI